MCTVWNVNAFKGRWMHNIAIIMTVIIRYEIAASVSSVPLLSWLPPTCCLLLCSHHYSWDWEPCWGAKPKALILRLPTREKRKIISRHQDLWSWGWGFAQWVELLLSMRETRSTASTEHTCNYGTWEVKTGESEVQGHTWLHCEFWASMDIRDTATKTLEGCRSISWPLLQLLNWNLSTSPVICPLV